MGEGLPSLWTQGDKVGSAARLTGLDWRLGATPGGLWGALAAAPVPSNPPLSGEPSPAPGGRWLKASKSPSSGAREATVAAGGQGKGQVLKMSGAEPEQSSPSAPGRGQAVDIPQLGQAQAPSPPPPILLPDCLWCPRLSLCLSSSLSKQTTTNAVAPSSLPQLLGLTCPFHASSSVPVLLGGLPQTPPHPPPRWAASFELQGSGELH